MLYQVFGRYRGEGSHTLPKNYPHFEIHEFENDVEAIGHFMKFTNHELVLYKIQENFPPIVIYTNCPDVEKHKSVYNINKEEKIKEIENPKENQSWVQRLFMKYVRNLCPLRRGYISLFKK